MHTANRALTDAGRRPTRCLSGKHTPDGLAQTSTCLHANALAARLPILAIGTTVWREACLLVCARRGRSRCVLRQVAGYPSAHRVRQQALNPMPCTLGRLLRWVLQDGHGSFKARLQFWLRAYKARLFTKCWSILIAPQRLLACKASRGATVQESPAAGRSIAKQTALHFHTRRVPCQWHGRDWARTCV